MGLRPTLRTSGDFPIGPGRDYNEWYGGSSGTKPHRSPAPTSPQRIVTQMSDSSVKHEAQRLIESLPDEATWEDLMYRIYVRQAIEAGLQDSRAGRTIDVEEVRARFGLSK